ncbi:BspA family leucine-rich repeat surface protein [Bifidobacterium sp. ESL0790]|nr:BspA family leucine-rich repeat surface protein [Bifidobacterium sp. ESL0790]WEV72594.1 BspA family leucine-rich repeat surface protein [Bifidobacterium sp. ESL0790]
MHQIFYGGGNLQTITDLSHWNISNVTDLSEAFKGFYQPLKLDLSGWDFPPSADTSGMFEPQDSGLSLAFIRLKAGAHIPADAFTGISHAQHSIPGFQTWKQKDGNKSWSGIPHDVGLGATSTTEATWYGWPHAEIKFTQGYYGTGISGTPPANLTADNAWFDSHIPATIPGQGTLLRNGYRFAGWQAVFGGKHYDKGDTIYFPDPDITAYGEQLNTFNAQWKSAVPVIAGAAPHADGVHVKVTDPAGYLAGDTMTVSDGTTTADATRDTVTGEWDVLLPLPTGDTTGQGTSTTYTATFHQSEGGTADSAPTTVTLDQVAPALENIRANTPAHQITGVAWSSGNTTAQPGRVKEGGDTITATWPGLGTTTTTTTSGAAGHEGEFTLPIPNGVTMPGDAVLTVSDTAGEHGLNGASNKSAEYTARLTPPITVLPFTGGGTPATWAATIAISAILALATGTILTKRAYAHTRPRH